MKNIFSIALCIFLGFSCDKKIEKCTPVFFENYQDNKLFGLIYLSPETVKLKDSLLCCYKIEFPFWERLDQPNNPKYIFYGYFKMVDNIVYYSQADSIHFNKIFEFSPNMRINNADTSFIELNIRLVAVL